VSLLYHTAWLDSDGRLVLANDIYGRDQILWAALRKPRLQRPGMLAPHPVLAGSPPVAE
jgi:hypothetical protein